MLVSAGVRVIVPVVEPSGGILGDGISVPGSDVGEHQSNSPRLNLRSKYHAATPINTGTATIRPMRIRTSSVIICLRSSADQSTGAAKHGCR